MVHSWKKLFNQVLSPLGICIFLLSPSFLSVYLFTYLSIHFCPPFGVGHFNN